MKHIIMGLIMFFTFVRALQRVVVFEVGTGTWCRYCPEIARAVEALKNKAKDTVIVIEYHDGDGFTNAHANARINYYSITGFPTTIVDGIIRCVGANYADSLEDYFNERKTVPPYAEIEIERNFLKSSLEGDLKITVKNINDFVLKGNLRTVITETNIPYEWFDEDSLYFVARVMVPDPIGDYVEIEPESSVVIEHEFRIDPGWYRFTDVKNCEIDVFLQTDEAYGDFSEKEIFQGAFVSVIPSPTLSFGFKFKDQEGKEVSGLRIGDTTSVILGITAQGDGLRNLKGILRTFVENVVITDSLGSWGDVKRDSTVYNDKDCFAVFLPSDFVEERVEFELLLTSDDGFEQEKSLFLDVVGIEETVPPKIMIVWENAVVYTLSKPKNPVTISIYDITGKKLWERQFKKISEKIKLNVLDQNGIYIIRIKDGKSVHTKKVIKIRS